MVVTAGLLVTLAAAQGDSLATLRSARDAQARFEWIRRLNLPAAPGRGGAACDERIGRFCFWHDDGDTNPPPAEPSPIREARERLVRQLDSAAALLPGDEWIAGQRVRYLLEANRTDAALAAARAGACGAAAWWCTALAGLALHAAGEFAAADSAYRIALREMPLAMRCRWTDLSHLLDGDLGRRYRRLGCEARAELEDRLWWLARPLHTSAGNDRRTEHFARATLSRIGEAARNPYATFWADDLRELTLRYGWPSSWTQEPAGWTAATERVVTGHEPSPAFHFLPTAGAVDDPAGARADDWALRAARPREQYAPSYARSWAPLEHQVALFRRGDSCLAVAAYDVGRDTLFGGLAPDAALVLAPDERTAPLIERRPGAGGAGLSDVIVAKTACSPQLLSLEVVAPARRGGHAARARYGVRPPPAAAGGISISDVLVLDPSDSLPTDLAAVLEGIRAPAAARSDSRVGLFWELYGLEPAGEAVTTAVTVAPRRKAWLRRATESLGLARRREPVRLQWVEVPRPRGSIAGRALALDLAGLSPGPYRIELHVVTPRGEAVATRELQVLERMKDARR